MARTLADIITSWKAFLRARQPSLELGEGSPERDIFIDAPAREFERFYDRLESVLFEQSIETASDTGLDKLASNYGILRKGAVRATGTVQFFRSTVPTGNVNIPVGTLVSTSPVRGATPVQFRTVEDATMYASIASSYLNTVTGKYEISVAVEAVVPGRSGIVASVTVNTLVTPVSQIDGVYNLTATTGGLDTESSDALAQRLSRVLAGTNIGTADGYLRLVSLQDGVEDELVVANGDSPRSALGAVDIYVKGKKSRTAVDTFTPFDPLSPEAFTPTNQPVVPSEAMSLIDSQLGALQQDTVWQFNKDASVLGGSTAGADTITFISVPSGGVGTLTLQYSYNALVKEVQNVVDKDSNKVVNGQVLVYWATEIPIDVTIRIRVLVGFDSTEVASLVQATVTNFLSTYGIGEEVQQADVARAILNVAGVDGVVLPLDTFRSSDFSIFQNSLGNLTIPSTGYASPGTVTITVIS